MTKHLVVALCAQIGMATIGAVCTLSSAPTAKPPSIGEPFSLRVRDSASVEGTGFSLAFSEVTQDSRCPKDVLCVVAGEAIVVFVVTDGGEQSELTFKVPPDGTDGRRFEEYNVTILELEPEAESGKDIDSLSYIAHIVVREIS